MENVSVKEKESLKALHDCLYCNVDLFIKMKMNESKMTVTVRNFMLADLRLNEEDLMKVNLPVSNPEYLFIKEAIEATNVIAEKARLVQADQLSFEKFLNDFEKYCLNCNDWKFKLTELYA